MNRTLFTVLILMILSVIGSSYYKYYYTKNYEFSLEAPCDPEISACFVRDCDGVDGCPPNGLEEYRIFQVKGADFDTCKDNSCLDECLSDKIDCTEIVCGDSEEDECAFAAEI